MESLDNTVRTPEQVETLSGLPSLGMIPLSLDISSAKNKSSDTRSIQAIPLLLTATPQPMVRNDQRPLARWYAMPTTPRM